MPGFRRKPACIGNPAYPRFPDAGPPPAGASEHQHREEVGALPASTKRCQTKCIIAPALRKEEDADGIGEAPAKKGSCTLTGGRWVTSSRNPTTINHPIRHRARCR